MFPEPMVDFKVSPMTDPIMADRNEADFLRVEPKSGIPIRKAPLSAERILEQVMAHQGIDVVARLKKELELTDEEAKLLFDDTKRFLFLVAMHPGSWSPPRKVDQGWHEFLMFTKDYADFCQRYFGRFIHHQPKRLNDTSTGISQTRNAILAARELFGDLSPNWDLNGNALFANSSLEVNADDCGSEGGFCSDS